MKKLAFLAVIITLRLQGLKAETITNVPPPGPTLPRGYTSVHLDLMILEQGKTNRTAGATIYHFKRASLTDNDLFDLINDEFETSFSTSKGDQLVISNMWLGQFSVLDHDGGVLLANASVNPNDNYNFTFTAPRVAQAGTQRLNRWSLVSVGNGNLSYRSGDGTNFLYLSGFITFDDEYSYNPTNNKESFRLTKGSGILWFPETGANGVITGDIYGSGKDNIPIPLP
jgi:hypothetical protein